MCILIWIVIARLFRKEVILIYPAPGNIWPCLPILFTSLSTLYISSFFIFANLIGRKWYHIVLICNYLMGNIKPINLFNIHMYFLCSKLFISFAHFPIELLVFYILVYWNYQYVVEIKGIYILTQLVLFYDMATHLFFIFWYLFFDFMVLRFFSPWSGNYQYFIMTVKF